MPPPPCPAVYSSHAFIDNHLFRSTCPHHIQTIINFCDKLGRRWGLDVNLDKREVHAMGSAAKCSFCTPTGAPLWTLHRHTQQPHTGYNYQWVYIYTNHQAVNTMDLVINEIRSFFRALLPLSLSLPEHIRLVNVQLIPVLTYSLMARPLTVPQLSTIHHPIWKHIRKPGDSARFTPKHHP